MTPEIIDRDAFIVVGVRAVLEPGSQAADLLLWKEHFLPRRGEVERFDGRYYAVFNSLPADKGGRYEYVAGVATDSLENIPIGMVGWVVPAGKYAESGAVGLSGIGQGCREVIADWLPDSGYQLVANPMFAYTAAEQPDSPEAKWKINVPVETPEALAVLGTWLGEN